MEKIFFNGVELTKYITVARGFTLSIGADFEPRLNSYEISSGSEFAYTRKKVKSIPVPFYNKTGGFEEYNELEKECLKMEVDAEVELELAALRREVQKPVSSAD